MNKKEFLGSLEKHLKYLPKEDKKDALDYYSEYIDDYNFAENEDISAKLGNPKDIAKQIIKECAEKHIDSNEKKKSAKGGATVVWMTILLIASLPVTLPIAVTLAIVLITVLFTAFVTLFALGLSFVIVAVAGIIVSLLGIIAPGIGQKLVMIGTGLIVTSIGVLLLIGVIKLTELLIRLLALISKSIIKKKQED